MKEKSYGIIPYKVDFKKNEIKILLTKTHKQSESYDFIKGKIEENETIKECAIREVEEEVNIKLNENELEDFVLQKNKNKDIGLFFVNFNGKDIDYSFFPNREIYGIEWFNISDLPKISNNQSKIVTTILQKFWKYR